MVKFVTAQIDEVAPKRQSRRPSQRVRIRQEYKDAMRHAVVQQHRALVVELEEGDKPLTIRNRMKRAAEDLGLQDITIRRRGARIVAYQAGEHESPGPGVLEDESVVSYS